MSNQELLKGNWNSIVGVVKERFGQITGDDLTRVQGNLDQFVGLLQRKAGQTREQVEEFLNECCSDASGTYAKVADTAAKVTTKAGRYVQDGYRQASDTADRSYDYAREVVGRRPVESVAIVAGVSLLAGVLIGLTLGNRR